MTVSSQEHLIHFVLEWNFALTLTVYSSVNHHFNWHLFGHRKEWKYEFKMWMPFTGLTSQHSVMPFMR